MMRKLGQIAFLLIILPGLLRPSATVMAQSALHDKRYYAINDAARNTWLRWCHLSSDHAVLPDCRNAEAAGNAAIIKRPGGNLSFLDDPAYYAQNPIARQMVRGACAKPWEPGAEAYTPHCRAAQ